MGTLQRRQREAQQRRAAILDAARTVFWQRGYAASTMPHIAERAEVAPGTLYLYFSSKEVLYVELLIEGYEKLRLRLAEAADTKRSASKQAHELIDAFFAFARENPEYFDIIFFVLQQEKSKWEANFPSDQVARLEQAEASCQQFVATVLQRLVKRSAKQQQALLNSVWSMLAGVAFFFRGKDDYDRTARAARDLLIQAVEHEH